MTVTIEITPVTRYTRQDVLRILHLQARQLQGWERAGLIALREPDSDHFSFEDLVQLRKLRDLRATRISAARIRASVTAMQRVSGMHNPLLEASAVRNGSRLAFRHSGKLVDPVSQQLMFDFDLPEQGQLCVVGESAVAQVAREAEAQEIFLRAVQLEENPATVKEAVQLYEHILKLHPQHAPACINLGTIHYNQHHYSKAEDLYRRASEADPEYALAFFDLGNVLDELQRLPEAVAAYQRAVHLVPQYADAHYNLALAYERLGERRRALRHWMAYAKLDPIGPWANHARGQARKILSMERLSIISRRGRASHVAAS
ncbi:MAG: tetratricopeptide repeat protein [Acidobacteriaceae bacterium]